MGNRESAKETSLTPAGERTHQQDSKEREETRSRLFRFPIPDSPLPAVKRKTPQKRGFPSRPPGMDA